MSKKMKEKDDAGFMVKVATFIVDKRNLFFLIFGIAIIFSLVSSSWVKVENALSAYLPDSTETSKGLSRMENEFITYGSAKIMVTNITYETACEISDMIEDMDSVVMLTFDDTSEHYNNFSALYDVTFNYPETDDKALEALSELEDKLSGYDIYVSTTMGDASAEQIESEMSVITVLVAIIVVTVLLPDMGGGSGASSYIRRFYAYNQRNEFYNGNNFVCLQFRYRCFTACALY